MRVIGKRQKPLVVIGDKVLTSHKGSICLVDLKSTDCEKYADLPISGYKKFLSNIRIFERLFRTEARNGVMLSEHEVLFTFDGGIYHLDLLSRKITKEKSFENGMKNPLGLTRIVGIDGFSDCVVYGEYIGNEKRSKSISLYSRSINERNWKKVYEFKPGTIRHIHGIKVVNGKVFLLTGDFEKEAGIWQCEEDFSIITPLMIGEQKYRSVHLFGAGNGFIYGTDTALEQNYIYKIENQEVKEISKIDGSCLSAVEGDEHYYFSTTVEADESVRGWRSWINKKRGPGILSDSAQIIAVKKENMSCTNILRLKKDSLPFKLFQYGQCQLMFSKYTGELLVYPVATKKYDGTLLAISESSNQ